MSVTVSGCTSQGSPPPRGSGATGSEPVDELLAELLPDGASGTLLAASGDEAAICRGFGSADREAGTACGCDTVYDIGSVTKQFTAAAILALEMAGELAVTDPIERFVGSVPPGAQDITLHHLLTHTAGLVGSLGGDYDVFSRDALVTRALSSTLRARPGTRYAYSNVGYSLLAAVVELVSGAGYEQFLAERLFGPAGMRQTGYVRPHWKPATVAVEYDGSGTRRGTPLDRRWAFDGPYWNLRGNGGILSTARDMYAWHRALSGEQILSGTAKRRLFRPHVREDSGESSYGYGWVVLPPASDGAGRVVTHNGSNGMSFAEFTRFLDRDAMVFWATSSVREDDGYDLEQLELTEQAADRLLGL